MSHSEVSPVETIERADAGLDDWVAEWYRALDRHDEISDVLPYLVDDGLELHFPEGIYCGHDGFRKWYEAVTHRFFDEVHEVRRVVGQPWVNDRTSLQVVVNWSSTTCSRCPAPRRCSRPRIDTDTGGDGERSGID